MEDLSGGSDLWTTGVFEGFEGCDEFSIDMESFERILSEKDSDQWRYRDQDPVLNCPEDLSYKHLSHGGAVPSELNYWSQSELQNSINESEHRPPREDELPGSSEWRHSEAMVPSDSRNGLGSEQMFEFPETSGMIFSHGKMDSVTHFVSPIRTDSVSLTDWSTMSCVEHDTCSSRDKDGGATGTPQFSYDRSTIPTFLPSCSTAFNFASGDSSGCSNHMNFMELKNERESDFRHAGDSHSNYGSHLTAVEESESGFGCQSAIFQNSMEESGDIERNFNTLTDEIDFFDVKPSLQDLYPTDIDGNRISDMHCEDVMIYTEQSSCEHSSNITDNSSCINSEKFPIHSLDPSFTEEELTCTNDEIKGQPHISQSKCTNSKINVKEEAAKSYISVTPAISNVSVTPKPSATGFGYVSGCQGTASKYDGGSHCSRTGIFPSWDAAGSSTNAVRKSLPGSQSFMPMREEIVSTEDQRDELPASNSASYLSSKVHKESSVDYCSSVCMSSAYGAENSSCDDQALNQLIPDTQSHILTKRPAIYVMDERKSEVTMHKKVNSNCPKVDGAVKSNSVYRSNIDEDADVCILEDISAPGKVPSVRLHEESHITLQQPVSDPLCRIGMGSTRLKAIDERITLSVALQDLNQPMSETTPPEGSLAVSLLRHQRIALSWMVQKETASIHCSGGILADDQGLGKTISTIALILTEKPPSVKASPVSVKQIEPKAFNLDDDDEGGILQLNGSKQDIDSGQGMAKKSSMKCDSAFMLAKGRPAAGTLVVCPTSVLRQWADELHNKVSREFNLSVLVYHGSNRTKDHFELAKYDVVLTTYSIVSMEVPKQPLVDKDDVEKGQAEDHGLSPGEFSSSKKRKYPPSNDKKGRKNKKGMDGALLESIARPLARVGWFRVVLDEAQSIKNHRTQVARACWGLRAKRRWCLSGTPIQNAIDDLYSYFRFLRYDPYSAYKSFCSMIKVPISRNPTNGYKKLQTVLKTIMLRRTKGTLLEGKPIINLPPKSVELKRVEFSMEERDFYSKLEADSRAQFKVYAAAGTVKQNYVNILLMLLRLRQACDHPLLVKGYNSSSVWRSSLETAKKLASEKQIQLLNCLETRSEICGICNDPPEDAVVTLCGHIFCNQCILEYLTGDENSCPAAKCKFHLSITSVFSKDTLRSSLSDQPGHDYSASQPVDTLKSSSQAPSDSSKIKAALEVLESLSKPMGSPSRNGLLNSRKVVTTCPGSTTESRSQEKQLSNTENSLSDSSVKVSEKAIVFSQWTRMLDLLEVHLKSSSIQYRRLDGTMSVLARDKAVKDFNTLPEVTVMIMSLKAASLGLNMVAACHVILLDLWWNPTTEDQAIDRAHRIGQTRPVTVLRLTVKDTVEDRILALQQKKRVMVASAFGEDETGSCQTRLTVDDLKYLFMA